MSTQAPKKIGIVCNRLASGGGMESHALSIIAEIVNLGFTPVIFTKNHKPIDKIRDLEIHSCPTKLIPRLFEDYFFSYWLKKEKKKAGVSKCIGFCRNSESDLLLCGGTHRGYSTHKTKRSTYDILTCKFESFAFTKAKFILPASKFIARELRELYQIEESKIKLAYPPIPERKFVSLSDADKLSARAKLGLDKDKTVLLFPSASGHERKGLPFILKSIKGLNNLQLAVAGKPTHIQDPNVIYIGYQTNMLEAYNAADYTILASYYEPFGLVGVESILCGTPVIMAENIGCTEILSNRACTKFCLGNPDELRTRLRFLSKNRIQLQSTDILYNTSPQDQALLLTNLLNNLS